MGVHRRFRGRWWPAVMAVVLWAFPLAMAEAQMLPGGTPRTRGLGGAGATDDTLGIVDNPASLGRRVDQPGAVEMGFALLPFPDLAAKEWRTDTSRFTTVWTRLAFRPPAGQDDLHWAVWYDSDSTVFAYRGFVAASDEPWATDTFVSFRELGGGVGFSPIENLSIGGGLGIGIYSVWGTRTGTVSGTTLPIDRTGITLLPKLHLGVEFFPLRRLALSLAFTDGPYLSGSTDTASKNFDAIDDLPLVGRGPTALAFNATYEFSAQIHATAQYRLLVPNPPQFSADPVPNAVHEMSLGGEFVFPIDGANVQAAARAGLTFYNLFDGVWDRAASVYEQFLMGLQIGGGMFIERFVFNISMGIVIWPDAVDFSGSRFAVSVGYLF